MHEVILCRDTPKRDLISDRLHPEGMYSISQWPLINFPLSFLCTVEISLHVNAESDPKLPTLFFWSRLFSHLARLAVESETL